MLNRPTEIPQTDAQSYIFSKVTPKSRIQHGINSIRFPILLDVPVETLTGITSHLDPQSLLSLGSVNKHLNHHIRDDNTWRRAFVQQFLGIGPENDLDDKKTLLLRRSERTWRQEFIVRCTLIRRWERSRNVTTAHVPVHSVISGMRLMPSHTLLTSSITYGIVARSVPLTGKVLSGYLDASGTRAGLGIGNPNAEFTPNVSACAMSSDGGTAKIVWGSQAGHLIFMSAPRAMETSRRSAADIKRCRIADEHEGIVLDVQWIDTPNSWVVSGGTDGRVKLWDAKIAECAWSSEGIFNAFIPDHCVKVAASITHGIIITVHESGDIHMWTGFDFNNPTRAIDDVKHVAIKCPIHTTIEGYDAQADHSVKTLNVDSTNVSPNILVAYLNDPYFYRLQIDLATGKTDTTAFGDPFFGATSVVVPFFRAETEKQQQSSFVFVGDHIGCVSLYSLDTDSMHVNPKTRAIEPLRKFEAHSDGSSVTAIAWNGLTLITGSARGMTYVWDALTFAPLRSFISPVPRRRGRVDPGVDLAARESVRHIVISPEKDVLFVGVGDRVMAWRAGPAPRHNMGGVRGRHSGGALAKKRGLNAKYLGQLELKETIQESRVILEGESKRSKRTYGREQEHRAGLDNLGLSEVEAVEYVLMLSREEANEANLNRAASSSLDVEEGVFEGDFEDEDDDYDQFEGDDSLVSRGSSGRPSISTLSNASGPAISSSFSSSSTTSSSSNSGSSSYHSVVSSLRSGMTTGRSGRPIPRFAPPSSLGDSNESRIRVSPPFREEPMEAGREYRAEEGPAEGTRMHIEDHYFPPIAVAAASSASTSPTENTSTSASTRGTSAISASSAPHGASHTHKRRSNTKTPPSVSPIQTPSGSPKSSRSSAASASGSGSAWGIPRKTSALSNTGSAGPSPSPSPVSSAAPRNAWAAGSSRISPPVWGATPQQQRRGRSGASVIAFSGGGGAGGRSGLSLPAAAVVDKMDDDLRFALELSLVEARSRGEDV